MRATVNGEPHELPGGSTVAALLRRLGVAPPGVAVAVNERVVPGAALEQHELAEGDVIEVIRPAAGG